jgi:hypothetical protein
MLIMEVETLDGVEEGQLVRHAWVTNDTDQCLSV